MFDEKRFIEQVKSVETGNYDMCHREFDAMYRNAKDVFGLCILVFKFGFLKGQRQAKANAKKKSRKTA